MGLSDEQIAKIKALSEKARQMSIEELVLLLEKSSDGANVHTVNKAIFYLNYFSNSEDARYFYGKPYDRLHDLKCEIMQSLEEKDFDRLSRYMRSWW